MSNKIVSMIEMEPRLDELFRLLEDCHIHPYINESDTNGSAVAQAEEDEQEFYVYAHTQSMDTLLETGSLFLGHDVPDHDLLSDVLNSIDGLEINWDKTSSSKVEIKPVELSQGYEWSILEDQKPQHNFFQDVMAANPDMSAQEISEELLKTMPHTKTATLH